MIQILINNFRNYVIIQLVQRADYQKKKKKLWNIWELSSLMWCTGTSLVSNQRMTFNSISFHKAAYSPLVSHLWGASCLVPLYLRWNTMEKFWLEKKRIDRGTMKIICINIWKCGKEWIDSKRLQWTTCGWIVENWRVTDFWIFGGMRYMSFWIVRVDSVLRDVCIFLKSFELLLHFWGFVYRYPLIFHSTPSFLFHPLLILLFLFLSNQFLILSVLFLFFLVILF